MSSIRKGTRWLLRSRLLWAILALVIVAFLWFVPQLQGEYLSQEVPAEDRPTLVNEYRRTWAQIIGGFGLFFGLYFTWRRVEISERTLEATRDQQVTERFTRAIDQLGASHEDRNPRLEVRLGGIYALERIARDSPKTDYSTVMQVLTAYVRQNTSQAPWSPKEFSDVTATSNEATAEVEDRAQQAASAEPRHPTADIQAILDVLSRAQTQVPEEYRTRLDIHEANLFRANLREANLREANLFRADLREADLREADLRGANLFRANLQGSIVGDEQLAVVMSLQGATMPDGSKHP